MFLQKRTIIPVRNDGDYSLVIPSGFEPEAYCLEGSCSIQLSYGTNLLLFCGCKDRHFFAIPQILD